MENILELAGLYPEGESERGFRLECGGGRIGVGTCGERLRFYGGPAAWSHYLERVGMVEDRAGCFPVERTSPKATPVRDLPHAFMIHTLLGGKRFVHLRRLQDDRALAAILGFKLARTAPQLDVRPTFERYLCWHNPLGRQKWLADPSP